MHVYLETSPEGEQFNCRGRLGEHDDAESFARMMKRSDLRVFLSKEHVGERVGIDALKEAKEI